MARCKKPLTAVTSSDSIAPSFGPPARVWAALTDPAILANWLGDVELELRVGGAVRWHTFLDILTDVLAGMQRGTVWTRTTCSADRIKRATFASPFRRAFRA